MNPLNFTEEDKMKAVQFLNMIAKHASYKMKTDELITYFRLLSHMQQAILPKIDANILEVKRVVEAKKEKDNKKAKESKEAPKEAPAENKG